VVIPISGIIAKKIKQNFSGCLEFLYAVRRTNVANIFAAFNSDCAKRERENGITGMRKRYINILHLSSKVNVSHSSLS